MTQRDRLKCYALAERHIERAVALRDEQARMSGRSLSPLRKKMREKAKLHEDTAHMLLKVAVP